MKDKQTNTCEYLSKRLGSLAIDPLCQRDLDERRVARMAENFDWQLFGTPVISLRTGAPDAVVLDGQHRIAAAKMAGHTDVCVKCLAHAGLTPAQEAALFLGLNTATLPKALDKHRVGVVAGRHDCAAVDSILAMHGLRLGRNSGSRVVGGAATLHKVYNMGVLDRVLRVTTSPWGCGNKVANEAATLLDLAHFLHAYGDAVDVDRLLTQLDKTPPTVMRNRVREYAIATNSPRRKGAIEEYRKVYNYRLSKKNRLPPYLPTQSEGDPEGEETAS
jgi:hypothetical protein